MSAEKPIILGLMPEVIELVSSPECIILSDDDEGDESSRHSTSLLAGLSASYGEAAVVQPQQNQMENNGSCKEVRLNYPDLLADIPVEDLRPEPVADRLLDSSYVMPSMSFSTIGASGMEHKLLFQGSISFSQIRNMTSSPVANPNTSIIPMTLSVVPETPLKTLKKVTENKTNAGKFQYTRTASTSMFKFANVMQGRMASSQSGFRGSASVTHVATSDTSCNRSTSVRHSPVVLITSSKSPESPDLEIISEHSRTSNSQNIFHKQIGIRNRPTHCRRFSDVPAKPVTKWSGFSELPDLECISPQNRSYNRPEFLEKASSTVARRNELVSVCANKTQILTPKSEHRNGVLCAKLSVKDETSPRRKFSENVRNEKSLFTNGFCNRERTVTPVKKPTQAIFKLAPQAASPAECVPQLRKHSERLGNEEPLCVGANEVTVLVEKTRRQSGGSEPVLGCRTPAKCLPSRTVEPNTQSESPTSNGTNLDADKLAFTSSCKPGENGILGKKHLPREEKRNSWFGIRPKKYFLLDNSSLEPDPSSNSCNELPDLNDTSRDAHTSGSDRFQQETATCSVESKGRHSINLKLNTPEISYRLWTSKRNKETVEMGRLENILYMAEVYLDESDDNSMKYTSELGLELLQEYTTQTGHAPTTFLPRLLNLLRMDIKVQLTYETLIHFHRFYAINRDINWWAEIEACMEKLNLRSNHRILSRPPGAFYALQYVLYVLVADAEQMYILPEVFTLKRCLAYKHISDSSSTGRVCQLAEWLGLAARKKVPTDGSTYYHSLVDLLNDFLTLAVAVGHCPLSMAAAAGFKLRTQYKTMSLDCKEVLLRSMNCHLLRYKTLQLSIEDLGFVIREPLELYPVTCRNLLDTSCYLPGKDPDEVMMVVKYAFQDYCACVTGQLHLPFHNRRERQLPKPDQEILVNAENLLYRLEDHMNKLYPRVWTRIKCKSALWQIRLLCSS